MHSFIYSLTKNPSFYTEIGRILTYFQELYAKFYAMFYWNNTIISKNTPFPDGHFYGLSSATACWPRPVNTLAACTPHKAPQYKYATQTNPCPHMLCLIVSHHPKAETNGGFTTQYQPLKTKTIYVYNLFPYGHKKTSQRANLRAYGDRSIHGWFMRSDNSRQRISA